MLQIGKCQNNHLIINGFLKIRHRGRDKFSAFCYLCKKTMTNEKFKKLHAPDWELSFNVRISIQWNSRKV